MGIDLARSSVGGSSSSSVGGVASTASIVADVPIVPNVYSAGPSLALAAGTWRVWGSASVAVGGNGGGWATAKIWDGVTVYRSATGYSNIDGGGIPLSLTPVDIVLPGLTTIKLDATSSSTLGTLRAAATTNGAGTNGTITVICAVRVA